MGLFRPLRDNPASEPHMGQNDLRSWVRQRMDVDKNVLRSTLHLNNLVGRLIKRWCRSGIKLILPVSVEGEVRPLSDKNTAWLDGASRDPSSFETFQVLL